MNADTILAIDRGRYKSAVGMRERVMPCDGVRKNRAPFDPAWSSRITT